MSHRSRLCHFVIDVGDLDDAVEFWAAALGAAEVPVTSGSEHVYRKLRLPQSNIWLLLQHTTAAKTYKSTMHLDVETDDVEAEVQRLELLGATRHDHQQARGFDFWVMTDPWNNEFCVLQEMNTTELQAHEPWPQRPTP